LQASLHGFGIFGVVKDYHGNCSEPIHSECFAFLMWAVRDASRLARPMNVNEICLKCKHFIRNFIHVHGVLNSYSHHNEIMG